MRPITPLVAGFAALLVSAAPASADANGGAYTDNGTPTAVASITGGRRDESNRSAGGSGGSGCDYRQLPADAEVYEDTGAQIVHTEPGSWYLRTCSGPGGEAVSYTYLPDAQPVDPAQLAAEAFEQLPLQLPAVATSPDPGQDQLVRVPTWLWVENGWAPLSASASVPGVTVTVTAVPRSVAWSMGDGGAVTCDGPGTPYDRSHPAASQSTDCSYTYLRPSSGRPGERYPAEATMTWSVSWSASGVAGGGDLGTVSRTTAFALRVAEAQALQTS